MHVSDSLWEQQYTPIVLMASKVREGFEFNKNIVLMIILFCTTSIKIQNIVITEYVTVSVDVVTLQMQIWLLCLRYISRAFGYFT